MTRQRRRRVELTVLTSGSSRRWDARLRSRRDRSILHQAGPASGNARASDSTSAGQVPSETCRRRAVMSTAGDNEGTMCEYFYDFINNNLDLSVDCLLPLDSSLFSRKMPGWSRTLLFIRFLGLCLACIRVGVCGGYFRFYGKTWV